MGYYLDEDERRRFLRFDSHVAITVSVRLSNGTSMPLIRQKDVVYMVADDEIDGDILLRVRGIEKEEIVAGAVEFLYRTNLRHGRAEHQRLDGIRNITMSARKIYVGVEAVRRLAEDTRTAPYVGCL